MTAIRVLLIEDNPGDARLIRELLVDARIDCPVEQAFEVMHVDRLSAGLAHLDQDVMDLVLLDLSLPDSQGLDTFFDVTVHAPAMPIVVLTGLDDQQLAIRAVQAGAQDYLVKNGLRSCALVRAMRYAIERKRLLIQLEEKAHELRVSETRLRAIVDNNPDGIVIVDKAGTVRFVNPAAMALFNKNVKDLVGSPFGIPLTPGETTEVEFILNSGATGIADMRVAEIEIGGEKHFLASLRDVTELVRLREKLRVMSLTDEMTGVYNRRGFFALAKQQLRLADRSGRGLLLLLADYDGLKEINDSLGHPQGDQALIETAKLLKDTFRESDVVARIGGDEFAVVAIEAVPASAETLIDRLQQNIESHNARRDLAYPLSLSIGTAYYNPDHPSSLEELLRQADAQMYGHKRRQKQSHRAPEKDGGVEPVTVDTTNEKPIRRG